MDIQDKLDLLGSAAQADLACGKCGEGQTRVRDDVGRWIYPAVRPDGKTVKMLKILQTNACEKDCFYCPTRRGRDVPRSTFQPEELAATFDQIHRAHLAEAIFISSGVAGGGTRTMERMLATAELLRGKYDFRGYIHLKLMPGAQDAAIERALLLADRVSVNLEAPSSEHLAKLSSTKRYAEELLAPLQIAKKLIARNPALAGKTMTTQFVVGAADESDRDILARTTQLYRELELARAYFSAFQPIENTPLENHAPTPLVREHRLYQSDFLFRKYGFAFADLIFDPRGNLATEADPKTVWATHHPEFFPIVLNRASKEQLLRIPGIGPLSASRILQSRRVTKFTAIEQLARIGADASRAAPFVLMNGRAPARQLALPF
ncbi:MAG: radical SAM protein [Chloroflexi bacterium]|nr:radical SAM protein [Chloroflexota bacterium]